MDPKTTKENIIPGEDRRTMVESVAARMSPILKEAMKANQGHSIIYVRSNPLRYGPFPWSKSKDYRIDCFGPLSKHKVVKAAEGVNTDGEALSKESPPSALLTNTSVIIDVANSEEASELRDSLVSRAIRRIDNDVREQICEVMLGPKVEAANVPRAELFPGLQRYIVDTMVFTASPENIERLLRYETHDSQVFELARQCLATAKFQERRTHISANVDEVDLVVRIWIVPSRTRTAFGEKKAERYIGLQIDVVVPNTESLKIVSKKMVDFVSAMPERFESVFAECQNGQIEWDREARGEKWTALSVERIVVEDVSGRLAIEKAEELYNI